MGRQYSKQEQDLFKAALDYAKISGVSKTKLSWALAALVGRKDGEVYHRLCGIESGKCDVAEDEEELTLTDESLDRRIGEVVFARVVSVKTYGALCVVEDTTRTLLLHVSEIADEYIEDVSAYLNEGDLIQAMLVVSTRENRLALSTKKIGSVKRKQQRNSEDDDEV